MTGQDALWSALEVKTQAEQVRGQVTIWEAVAEALECAGCNAEAGEPCRWGCLSREVPRCDKCGQTCEHLSRNLLCPPCVKAWVTA